ncbi:MAG: hypothetical protein RR788_04090, partial [Erysipelotrichaceae bacterium]
DKLQQIINLKNAENEKYGMSKLSEKAIVEESINLLHSSLFGKDVFDQTMNKLEIILGNRMQKVLNEYATPFAQSLENIYEQNNEIKQMLLLILRANDIMPEDQSEINSLIRMNTKLENSIKDAILIKSEME